MFLLLAIILVTTLVIYLQRKYSYWKRHGVPAPDAKWFVGNLGPVFTMSKHFGTFIDELYNKYSDVPYVGYYNSLSPGICIRDPNLIKDILIKDFHSFANNDFGFDEKNDPLLSHNPFFTTGDRWKTSRQILTPLFTSSKMKTLFPVMERACERLKAYIKQFGSNYDFDARELAAKFTTDNMSNISFSLDSGSFNNTNSEFRNKSRKFFETTTWQAFKFMVIIFIPKIVNVFRFSLLRKDIDVWIRRLVRENIESRKSLELPRNDLLEMLLASQHKAKLNEEQVAGHALSFFSEGTESVGNVLSNVMYELARHQDIQERLYEEVAEVLARHNNKITYDAVQEMSYLDGVVHETLRIRPIVLTSQKLCTRSYKLDPLPGQKEGFVIPIGMGIVIPINAIHFDPAYFPNPHEFDPLRYTEEEIKNRPKCVYMGFGEGPRICLGFRLAMVEIKSALVHVIKSFKINVSPNCKPFEMGPGPFFCLSKHPLLLNYEPRS